MPHRHKLPEAAEILVISPNPTDVLSGGHAMSFRLFNLVPAIYRLRDGQIAATMQLLTPDEQTELYALQTHRARSIAEQTALMEELTAKRPADRSSPCSWSLTSSSANFAADLDQLYDNQFIETCAPWVIPYIGELIGFQPD